MSRIIVTGASGFVGGAVARAYAGRGHEVIGVVRGDSAAPPGVSFVRADLAHAMPDLGEQQDAVVVHSAARMRGTTLDDFWGDNVEATRRVLDWSARHRARHVVFVSSGGVYPYATGHFHDEDERELPIGHYGYSKLIGEDLCRAYAAQAGLSVSMLRLFFPFGRTQHTGLVPMIAEAVQRGRTLSINRHGAPRMNPVFIDDVVSAITAVVDACRPGVRAFNVCGDEVMSFEELVKCCEAHFRRKAVTQESGLEQGDLLGANSRLRTELGWRPSIGVSSYIAALAASGDMAGRRGPSRGANVPARQLDSNRVTTRVALLLVGARDISGGGGAERYFADLFLAARRRTAPEHEVVLFTDRATIAALAATGRDLSSHDIVILPGAGRATALVQAVAFLVHVLRRQIDIVHIAQALPRHLLWLYAARCIPRRWRPRVSLNVNDARLAHGLLQSPIVSTAAIPPLERRTYDAYFRGGRLTGLMVWYSLFVERFASRYRRVPPVVHAARYCFVDTARFAPAAEKRNWVVFSGRLVDLKRPLLFVDGVADALRQAPALFAAWDFFIFGNGPLLEAVQARLAALGLSERVKIGAHGDLRSTLARSSIFVSTQDFENFTSLAMLEAMASGNAIIARDVGQTRLFVTPRSNGLLMPATGTASALGQCLVEAVESGMLSTWGAESRRLSMEMHTVEHVLEEFDRFWHEVARA